MPPTRRHLAGATLGLAAARGASARALGPQDLLDRIAPQREAVIHLAREVITMDPRQPRAEAVAVVGDRIAAVGSLAELQALAGDQPFRVDRSFEGKVVLPGFIEQHVHPVLSSLTMVSEVIAIEDWDTAGGFSPAARDEAGYRRRFAEALAAHRARTPGAPFITWGYHPQFHGSMSRAWLDAQAGETPVVVWHRSTHAFHLNTALMQRLRMDEAFLGSFTPSEAAQADPAAGHFYEQGALKLMERIAPLIATPERMRRGLEFTVGLYHRNGITTAAEPGGFYAKPLQDAINAVYAPDTTPFNHYFIPDGKSFAAMFPGDGAAQLREAQKPLAWGAGRVRWLPKQIKLLLDGAIYSQLMQMRDGYTDGHRGAWIMDPEVFSLAFQTYWDADYQIHIHNNGDGGLDVLLANLERAMRRRPRFDHRTTIVHFGFAAPEQIRLAARLGCIVSANPYYVTALAGRYAEVGLGPARARRMVPLREAAEAGLPISLHSDMPMAPAHPLTLIWAAVNRLTAEGPVMGEEQRIPLDLALRAMTVEAAASIRLENELGSITPGKLANFTVLEESPYAVPPEALKDIPVWGTVLEGRVQPAPPGPRRRAGLPRRLAGGEAPSGRFAGGAALAAACAGHPFCVHRGAEAALGCGCGGDAFSALIAAALARAGEEEGVR